MIIQRDVRHVSGRFGMMWLGLLVAGLENDVVCDAFGELGSVYVLIQGTLKMQSLEAKRTFDFA